MARTKLLIAATVAVVAMTACGRAAVPSGTVGPPASEAPPSGLGVGPASPTANDKPPEPLTCEDWVIGISDYPPGATGIADPLEATRTTEAVNHLASDVVTRTGHNTQIVRDGEIIYFAEWHPAEDGSWLLGEDRACQSAMPPRPEEWRFAGRIAATMPTTC